MGIGQDKVTTPTTMPIRNARAAVQAARIDQNKELAPGTLLGGAYRLIRCLGRGGMGDVHVALSDQPPGEVVVKVLSPELIVNSDALVRFRQEAMVMASIHHPNVIRLLDFDFTERGRPYLVMEYLPGKNLSELLNERTFSPAEVSSIVRQVASALHATHQLGVVHRDLKPENIMVVPRPGQSDLIKVIDFGICKARRLNHLTTKGMVMGTPEFMSPEQAQGRHEEVEAASDQFALAVITYLLLAGRFPWLANTPAEFIHCAVYKYPLALRDDDSYRSVEAALFRAMSKDSEDRYPSILAYADALDQALVDAGLLPRPASRRSSVSHAESSPEAAKTGRPTGPSVARGSEKSSDRTRKRRSETLSRQRRRGAQVGWAAMLLMVLVFGAYLGVGGAPAAREDAGRGWNAFFRLATAPFARGTSAGHRLFSRASKNAKVYLSLDSSP